MILSFADDTTRRVFEGLRVPQFAAVLRPARRKLMMIDAAVGLNDLRLPPGNRLEHLRGKLAGFWSIRINDQWRIIFRWTDGGAADVGIIDYH